MLHPSDMSAQERMAYTGIAWTQTLVHQTATRAGRYNDPATGQPIKRNFGELVALMHSELSEALEGHRKSLMDTHLTDRPMPEVEFADCIIRILDTAAAYGYDVAGALIEKNRYNRQREDHKPENRAKDGGVKY